MTIQVKYSVRGEAFDIKRVQEISSLFFKSLSSPLTFSFIFPFIFKLKKKHMLVVKIWTIKKCIFYQLCIAM